MASDDGDIAALLARAELASRQHRVNVARRLGLAEPEALTLELLLRDETVTPGVVGEALGLTSGGVTSLIDRLVADGQLRRVPNPRDGRSRVLSLTRAGRQAAEAYVEAIRAPTEETSAWLSTDDAAVVGRFLRHLAVIREVRAREAAEQTRRRRGGRADARSA